MLEASEILKSKDLLLNDSKSQKISIIDKNSSDAELEYLGYKFIFKKGKNVEVGLSGKKINKIITRARLAIEDYKSNRYKSEKEARKLLVKRIKYLTGNTRLTGRKKHILVGIYFSNSILTQFDDLGDLDGKLRTLIDTPSYSLNPRVKERLSKYSFVQGFKEYHKMFYPFSYIDICKITDCWGGMSL